MRAIEPAASPLPVIAASTVIPPADPYEVYLNSLESAESRRTMRGALDRIAKILTEDDAATGAGQPWWGLRYEHTSAVRAALIDFRDAKHPDGYSPTHINKHLIGLRQILRTSWRLELITAEDYHRAIDIKNVKGKRLPAGRNIHRDELGALLRAAGDDEGPAGTRDRALVALLYATGLRRSEAASLLVEDFDHAERQIRIIGKGNKERAVPVSLAAIPVLDEWLNLLGTRRGPMFRRIDRHGNIRSGAMSPRAVGYIVDRTRKKASLPPLATHDFRRTFIGDFIDNGGDLVQAQRIAGHASATTTAQYDRRPGRALRDAVDRMSLPLPHGDRSETFDG
ncbi:tyrosine-type recombinase/integrase [Spirillospora sp. NPDC048911]|uniref:tyrosine-type recombinase/integrase n=1 Tax=Spirillospora sp. NPDC048911 TaxID=3364527 RepID=UPI003714E41E